MGRSIGLRCRSGDPMTRLRGLSLVYGLLLVLMAGVGLSYEGLSPGLAAPTDGAPFFCRELRSSGGEDDALIIVFAVFLVPLGLRVFRFAAPVARVEAIAFWVCGALVCFALFLAGLDCGSVFYTAFVVPDPLLAGALMALPGAALLLVALRARSGG